MMVGEDCRLPPVSIIWIDDDATRILRAAPNATYVRAREPACDIHVINDRIEAGVTKM